MAAFPASLVGLATGSSHKMGFRTLTSKFGDGYSQRASDGINIAPLMLDLTFKGLTTLQFQGLRGFLQAQGGVTPFTFNPPSPNNFEDSALYVNTTSYVVGDVKADSASNPKNVYVCIADIAGDAANVITDTTYWAFLTRTPMKFICPALDGSYVEYNHERASCMFIQVFDT